MKKVNIDRKAQRDMRHKRITDKITMGDKQKPRLVVTKTNANIFVQIIDDTKQKTLVSSSTTQLKLSNGNLENAKLVGTDIAKKALKAKITEVVFDRGGNKYHGKIKALAEAAREAGLKF